MYFKTLQPLEFTDLENAITKEQVEEETGVKMRSSKAKMSNQKPDTSDEHLDKIFDALSDLGEDEDLDNWELIDERPVEYSQEEGLDKMLGLASTGRANPNASSEQDEQIEETFFKVRYQYAPLTTKQNSREFCKKMVGAAKIYRKEDIERMSSQEVNAGFGLAGADTYDIWLYKGGANCHHFWMRKTYRAKDVRPDATNPNAEVSVNRARQEGLTPEVNDPLVARRPIDMPNNGYANPR
jgi:hypothetical protein